MTKRIARGNWTQEERKANLDKVAGLITKYGGYGRILTDMVDFLHLVSFQIGCSEKTARDYVETVRGASIFMMREKNHEAS